MGCQGISGPHSQVLSSPGSCSLISFYSNLEAQRPHLSESCSIGKPARVQSLPSARSCAVVKDALKATQRQISPVAWL